MPFADTSGIRRWIGSDLLAGLLLAIGTVLTGVGGYFRVTIATQVSAGRCDGCEPWHPLIVLAPLITGGILLLLAGYLPSRRYVQHLYVPSRGTNPWPGTGNGRQRSSRREP
jgi:hypothetical protein